MTWKYKIIMSSVNNKWCYFVHVKLKIYDKHVQQNIFTIIIYKLSIRLLIKEIQIQIQIQMRFIKKWNLHRT